MRYESCTALSALDAFWLPELTAELTTETRVYIDETGMDLPIFETMSQAA